MNLELRINGEILRKYGYSFGQTILGKMLAVDDQWNGLSMEKEIAIQIE